MIPIFTPLKDGQALMPDVMEGVLSQSIGCCLVPITGKTTYEHSELNKASNVLRALSVNKRSYFILMDSDVVMGNDKMIEDMLNDKANMGKDIVLVTTKKEQLVSCPYSPHSLMLIKGTQLDIFTDFVEKYMSYSNEEIGKVDCFVCKFISGREDKCAYLQNNSNSETTRLDLTNE